MISDNLIRGGLAFHFEFVSIALHICTYNTVLPISPLLYHLATNTHFEYNVI